MCEFKILAKGLTKGNDFKAIGGYKSFDMGPHAIKIDSEHELDMGHGYTLRFAMRIIPACPMVDALLYKKETKAGNLIETDDRTPSDAGSTDISTGSITQEKLDEVTQALKETTTENDDLKRKMIELSSEMQLI